MSLAGQDAMIDALMILSKPLLQMSFEHVLSVAVTKALPAYIDLLSALDDYAVDWDYISANDIELGEPLAYFREHVAELKSAIR